MKSLVSLVKKEWYTYRLWWISFILFGVIFILILPILLEHFLNNVDSEEMRITTLFTSVSLLIFIPIIQLVTSIHRDIKIKDIWLHNPSSIFTLIGAKWLFVLCALFVTCLFCFSGFFLLGDNINGSFGQIMLLILLLTVLETLFYIFISIVSLLFFALHLQIKRYIGQFSLIVVFTLTFLFLWFLNKVPEKYIQIPYWKIPTNWIYDHLPTFKNGIIHINVEFYFVDLIVNFLLLIIFYIGACKWIERVITR